MSQPIGNRSIKQGVAVIVLCMLAVVFILYLGGPASSAESHSFARAARFPFYGALYGFWLIGKGVFSNYKASREEKIEPFLLSEDPNELAQQLFDLHEKWHVIGEEMADDCYSTHLLKGSPALLSQISEACTTAYGDRGRYVEFGFLRRMRYYIDSGVVKSLAIEGGDSLLIHKDHFKSFVDEHFPRGAP